MKSLVLANETAKQDLEESRGISSEEYPYEAQSSKTGANTSIARRDTKAVLQDFIRGTHSSQTNALSPHETHLMSFKPIYQLSSVRTSSALSVASPRSRYAQAWNVVDRLELALRKVETAT